MKNLQAQKRRKTAASYLPLYEDSLSDFNTLVVQIHRCSNLNQLADSMF